jgi:hypothetical protein
MNTLRPGAYFLHLVVRPGGILLKFFRILLVAVIVIGLGGIAKVCVADPPSGMHCVKDANGVELYCVPSTKRNAEVQPAAPVVTNQSSQTHETENIAPAPIPKVRERAESPDPSLAFTELSKASQADPEAMTPAFLNAALLLTKKLPLSVIRQLGDPKEDKAKNFGLNPAQTARLKSMAELAGQPSDKLFAISTSATPQSSPAEQITAKEATVVLIDRIKTNAVLGAVSTVATMNRKAGIDRIVSEQKYLTDAGGLNKLAESQAAFYVSIRDHEDRVRDWQQQLRSKLAATGLDPREKKHLQLMLLGSLGKADDPVLADLNAGEANQYLSAFNRELSAKIEQGRNWNQKISEGVKISSDGKFSVNLGTDDSVKLKKMFSPDAVASYAVFLFGQKYPGAKELAEKIWHVYIGPQFTLARDGLSNAEVAGFNLGDKPIAPTGHSVGFRVNPTPHDYAVILSSLQGHANHIVVQGTGESRAGVPAVKVEGEKFELIN